MPDLEIGERGDDVINYLRDHYGGFFDFIQRVMTVLLGRTYDVVSALEPTLMVVILMVLALVATRRIGLTVMLGVGLFVIESMDLWFETMQSRATVLVATAVALVVGIPLGIWAAFSPLVRAIVTPLPDFMQTIPVFVYLLPTVLFFGIGPVPGVVATIIFAAPPAVRLPSSGSARSTARPWRPPPRSAPRVGRCCGRCSCRLPGRRSWRASTRSSCWRCR